MTLQIFTDAKVMSLRKFDRLKSAGVKRIISFSINFHTKLGRIELIINLEREKTST